MKRSHNTSNSSLYTPCETFKH